MTQLQLVQVLYILLQTGIYNFESKNTFKYEKRTTNSWSNFYYLRSTTGGNSGTTGTIAIDKNRILATDTHKTVFSIGI